MTHRSSTRPASIGRRVGASALDIAILYATLIVVGGIGVGVLVASGAMGGDGAAGAVVGLSALFGVAGLAGALGYTAMQGGAGSIGQRALGVRVCDETSGAPIGFGRALLRNIIWGLGAAIVVGCFSPLFDSSGGRQGWHDRVARGLVVNRRATDAAASASASGSVSGSASAAPAHPASASTAPTSLATVSAGTVAPGAGTVPSVSAVPPVRIVIPAEPIAAGLISQVPGAGRAPAPVLEAPAPIAPDSSSHPVQGAASEDLEATRAAAPSASPAVLPPAGPIAMTVLTWDDGTRIAVYGRTLFGRNPATEDGAARVAVRDETLSLSKTHFEVGGDDAGPWIVDRHSTNGSVLVRSGSPHRLIAGAQTSLRDGDRLEFGDRSLTVGSA